MKELSKGDWDIRGTWHPWTATESDGRVIRGALICCPTCGRDSSLSRHTISPDGTVTPSCICPEGCGFHDYVKLVGWAEEFPPAPPAPQTA